MVSRHCCQLETACENGWIGRDNYCNMTVSSVIADHRLWEHCWSDGTGERVAKLSRFAQVSRVDAEMERGSERSDGTRPLDVRKSVDGLRRLPVTMKTNVRVEEGWVGMAWTIDIPVTVFQCVSLVPVGWWVPRDMIEQYSLVWQLAGREGIQMKVGIKTTPWRGGLSVTRAGKC